MRLGEPVPLTMETFAELSQPRTVGSDVSMPRSVTIPRMYEIRSAARIEAMPSASMVEDTALPIFLVS